MFIQTEQTPNPATLKFLPGRIVMESGTANFTTAEGAQRSPLATRIFGVDVVTGTKDMDQEWHVLKPAILGVIMEHFTAGRPVIEAAADAAAEGEGEDDE